MSFRSKGSRAERELFHMLWEHGYSVLRAAGSGSTTRPAPDLLASNGTRTFAIECKSIKGTRKYFADEEIQQLLTFASGFGAEPWIGVRFDNKGWYFISARDVQRSKGTQFVLSLEFLQKNGCLFEEFIGMYQQRRLP